MSEHDARALAEFVHDHDKRFAAKAHPDADQSMLLLTLIADGTSLPLVPEWSEYERLYMDADNPGPTVRAAWDKWRARQSAV